MKASQCQGVFEKKGGQKEERNRLRVNWQGFRALGMFIPLRQRVAVAGANSFTRSWPARLLRASETEEGVYRRRAGCTKVAGSP
jgi:hypothetical protein